MISDPVVLLLAYPLPHALTNQNTHFRYGAPQTNHPSKILKGNWLDFKSIEAFLKLHLDFV